MFAPRMAAAAAFRDHLATRFAALWPDARPGDAALLAATADRAMAHLVETSAAYHDHEHTMLVTLAGLALLDGQRSAAGLAATDALHALVATLLHDVGFSRTACPGDSDSAVVTGPGGERAGLPPGASDACLAPWHVDRSMIAARAFLQDHPRLDADRVASAIAFTRFPVPDDPELRRTEGEGPLVRAADLIGQLGDPLYLSKLPRLLAEMQETGAAEAAGYRGVAEMRAAFPDFVRAEVAPWIGPARALLGRTAEGRRWLDTLARNLDAVSGEADQPL